MPLLIISLPLDCASSTALYDYVQSPDGSTASAHACVPLALLPLQAGQQVVLVLPAQALSWHQLQLPQGSLPRTLLAERGGSRLRAILDGLLEDQLLDDPAQLHLALQPQPVAAAPVWVAACARDWLTAGLKALAQAGHEVSRIVPEFSLQALSDTIFVIAQPQGAQVAGLLQRDAAGSPGSTAVLVCPLASGAAGLLEPQLAAATSVAEPATDAAPLRHIVAEPAVAVLAEAMFKRPVTLQQRPQRLLQAAQTDWDLAQFELAHARRDRRWALVTSGFAQFARAPAWRAARWSLVVLLLVNLLGLNALAWREQAALQAQRAQIRAVLTDTFPKIPVVVDAPLQMAREVALLQRTRGNAAGADLEGILASFSTLAPAEYALTAIEYVANELRLSGPPMSPQVQQQLENGLKARGLSVSVQNGQWKISPGGAQ